jgi:hypothetical protein
MPTIDNGMYVERMVRDNLDSYFIFTGAMDSIGWNGFKFMAFYHGQAFLRWALVPQSGCGWMICCVKCECLHLMKSMMCSATIDDHILHVRSSCFGKHAIHEHAFEFTVLFSCGAIHG